VEQPSVLAAVTSFCIKRKKHQTISELATLGVIYRDPLTKDTGSSRCFTQATDASVLTNNQIKNGAHARSFIKYKLNFLAANLTLEIVPFQLEQPWDVIFLGRVVKFIIIY
jgi:hypothetical protein